MTSTSGPRRRTLAIALLIAWTLIPRLWFAQPEPNQRRAWDERYSVRNVALLMVEGPTRLDNGFYPGLSFLPHLTVLAACEWMANATGRAQLAVIARRGGPRMQREGRADGLDLTPFGYRTARRVNALFGTASVLLCFAIARRPLGDGWGLAVATLVASMPWHIRISAIFKPDIVLLTCLLLALYAAIRAADRVTPTAYAAAGLGVGLALSTKFNGLAVVAPFAVAAAMPVGTTWRHFARRCALGAVAAIAVFVVTNPWTLSEPDLVVRDFSKTVRQYDSRGGSDDATRLTVLSSAGPWLANPVFHGPVPALLAAGGLLLVTASLVSSRRRSEHYPEGLLLLTLGVAYVATYSAATRDVSSWHNWLMVTPTSAFCAVVAARWLLRPVAPVPTAVAATTLVAGLVALPGATWTYRQLVPHVVVESVQVIRDAWRDPGGRVVATEVPLPPGTWRQPFGTTVEQPALGSWPDGRLLLTDAQVYLSDGPSRDDLTRRSAELGPEQIVDLAPRLLQRRGADMRLLIHPLRRAGRATIALTPSGTGVFTGLASAPNRVAHSLSLELRLPPETVGTARIGATLRPLQLNYHRGGKTLFATERVPLAPAPMPIRIELETPAPGRIEATLYYWRRPEPGP